MVGHIARRVLVTGGAGFIGVNFIRYLFAQTAFGGVVVNFDKLTYAGNRMSLADIEEQWSGSRYFFVQGDICDAPALDTVFHEYQIDTIVHFAAESHVDRSIVGPRDFIDTNIIGTFQLLEAARRHWTDRKDVRFHHVSTDEVFGSLPEKGLFCENTPYDPHSPYSASKASSDHLARAYLHTYGLPVTVSNCSNNYGPYQFPEKMIPLMIVNGLTGQPLPVYGDGKNIRDWLYVVDHCAALWLIITAGRVGETYNIGGRAEMANIDVVRQICATLDVIAPTGQLHDRLITPVKDRPGHDRRYAINCEKIFHELGWTPAMSFAQGLERTIRWYVEHADWVKMVQSGAYRHWLKTNYDGR